jgi:hypothetical protein
VKNQGFKLVPMKDTPEPRKRARSSKPRDDDLPAAGLPIPLLQQAGRLLEIEEAELAPERLTASPSKPTSPSGPDVE